MSNRHDLPALIRTARLTLRAPVAADTSDIVAMADNPKMPLTTGSLPHPYGSGDAAAFIAEAANSETLEAYAIADSDDRFIGAILFKYAEGKPPEIAYWLGEPHWGQGYAGEAVAALVAAAGLLPAFSIIDARVLVSNPASVRVLEKAGFRVIEHTLGVLDRHRGKPLLVLQWSAP